VLVRDRSLGPRPTPDPTRPGAGDRAYSSRAICSQLRRRRIKTSIPEPTYQQARRLRQGSHGGQPPKLEPEIFQQRTTVERAVHKLEGYRAWPRDTTVSTPSAEPSTSP
jgi:hypothetical protein